MRQVTLCFPINEQDNTILLGMKKRGFGAGKYNGFGGKPEQDETLEQTIARELKEEVGLIAKPEDFIKYGIINYFFPHKPDWNQQVHAYLLKQYEGEEFESEEMRPSWFNMNHIPYERMWKSDKIWLPLLLDKVNLVSSVIYDENNSVKKIKLRANYDKS